MATTPITVPINVTSGGTTDRETKKAKGLKDMLDQTAASATRAGRAMAASRSAGSSGGGGGGGTAGSAEVMEYGRSRAIGIGTGAAGRDFANQAQGLGGVVRLYATYAANVFAVGAAFRALSEAMNTASMVRGLDQLGAASGTALGTLAKRFTEASGEAISLRESMEATTKAVSSGLSAQQFLQLGEVANKASQALGLNMSDAVSRLTRGITKLEPELLDELGLFTKIGPATEEYAKKVEKTVSSLTDFERRQAFANAVLEEGISKFGQIDLPANPYDQLAASLRNLTQQILEVVNTGLGPLIKTLSTSPTALGAGIAALGVTLLKQALPALGEYRQELQQSARIATQRAQVKAQEANEARLQAFGAAIKKADQDAQDAADRADANLTKVEKLIKSSRSRVAESVKPILAKQNILEITPQELKVLEDLGQKNTKLSATYRQLAQDIQAAINENNRFNQAVQAQAAARAQEPGKLTAAGRAQTIAKRAQDIATQQQIISQAGYAGSVLSLRQGFGDLFKSIGESQMGPIRKGFTAVAGSVSLVTTALTSAVSAVQGWIFIAGALVAGFKVLDGWLSDNKDQLQKFNSAVEDSSVAVKTYNNTLDYLSKNVGTVFTTAGLEAYSNAVTGLSNAVKQLGQDFLTLEAKTKGWDRFTDNIAKFFGGGAAQNFAEAMSELLTATVASIDDAVERSDFEAKISRALGVEGGQTSWEDAIAKGGVKAALALKGLGPEFDALTTKLNNTTSRSKEFDSSFKQVQDSYKKFTMDLKDKSPYTELGNSLLGFSTKLAGAISDPSTGLQSFLTLLKDTDTIRLISPDQLNSLTDLQTRIKTLADERQRITTDLRLARAEEARARKDIEDRVRKATSGYSEDLRPKMEARYREQLMAPTSPLGNVLREAQNVVSTLTIKQESLLKDQKELLKDPTFSTLIYDAFQRGSTIVFTSIVRASQQSTIDYAKSVLGMLGGVPGSAQLEGALKQQEIQLRLKDVTLREELIRIQNQQILATVANTTALNIRTNLDKLSSREGTQQEREERTKTVMGQLTFERRFESLLADVTKFASKDRGARTVSSLQLEIARLGKLPEVATDPEKIQRLQQLVQSIATAQAIRGERITLLNQKEIVGLETKKKISEEELKIKMQGYDFDIAANKVAQARLQLEMSGTEIASNAQIDLKASLEDKDSELRFEKEKAAIQLEAIARTEQLDALQAKLKGTAFEQYVIALRKGALDSDSLKLKTAEEKREAEKLAIEEKVQKEALDRESKLFAKQVERNKLAIEFDNARSSILQEIKTQEFEYQRQSIQFLKESGALTEEQAGLRSQTVAKDAQASSNRIKVLEIERDYINSIREAYQKYNDPKNILRDRAEVESELFDAVQRSKALYDLRLSQQTQSNDLALRGITIEEDRLKIAKQLKDLEKSEEIKNLELDTQSKLRDIEKERLKQQYDLGYIRLDTYNQEVRALEEISREAEYQANIRKVQLNYEKEILKLKPLLETDDPLGPTPEVVARYMELEGIRERELWALKRVKIAQDQLVKGQETLTERQQGYVQVFESAVTRMSDAFANFAETGKFKFKDFANSVLSDILRLESRMLASQIWGGIRGSIIQAFTGAPGAPGASNGSWDVPGTVLAPVETAIPRQITVDQMIDRWKAKGAAYVGGIEKFAKGGTFTNSIVDNPTIFKFAQGVGMMGEAGPEAIMPLKRDSSGNLGVRAQGSKTEVVVNNYSSQPAEARETVDSRGNRRIEVTVGDMVAGEMARSGSATQKAVRSTFGMQPALIRR